MQNWNLGQKIDLFLQTFDLRGYYCEGIAHVGGTISSLDSWMDMQGHVRGLAGSFVYKTGGQFVRLSCNFNRLKGIPRPLLPWSRMASILSVVRSIGIKIMTMRMKMTKLMTKMTLTMTVMTMMMTRMM